MAHIQTYTLPAVIILPTIHSIIFALLCSNSANTIFGMEASPRLLHFSFEKEKNNLVIWIQTVNSTSLVEAINHKRFEYGFTIMTNAIQDETHTIMCCLQQIYTGLIPDSSPFFNHTTWTMHAAHMVNKTTLLEFALYIAKKQFEQAQTLNTCVQFSHLYHHLQSLKQ